MIEILDIPLPLGQCHTNRQTAFENNEQFYIGKPCKHCKNTKRYTHSKKCFECVKLWNGKNKEKKTYKLIKRNWQLKNTYGITLQQYNQLLENQNYLCKLCGTKLKNDKSSHVDHCHNTKKIRGLLCHHCNVGIGYFKHNPALLRKAALYCEAV